MSKSQKILERLAAVDAEREEHRRIQEEKDRQFKEALAAIAQVSAKETHGLEETKKSLRGNRLFLLINTLVNVYQSDQNVDENASSTFSKQTKKQNQVARFATEWMNFSRNLSELFSYFIFQKFFTSNGNFRNSVQFFLATFWSQFALLLLFSISLCMVFALHFSRFLGPRNLFFWPCK